VHTLVAVQWTQEVLTRKTEILTHVIAMGVPLGMAIAAIGRVRFFYFYLGSLFF
jgi:hypothetical protein